MKTSNKRALMLSQAEKRSSAMKKLASQTTLRTGWIFYMRNVLGMKQKDLAKRANIALPTAAQSERREAEGNVNLETLRKMAHAMNCDLVYGFVPRKKIKTTLQEQALLKAKHILLRADTHMSLEDQKVLEPLNVRIKRLAQVLLESGDVW